MSLIWHVCDKRKKLFISDNSFVQRGDSRWKRAFLSSKNKEDGQGGKEVKTVKGEEERSMMRVRSCSLLPQPSALPPKGEICYTPALSEITRNQGCKTDRYTEYNITVAPSLGAAGSIVLPSNYQSWQWKLWYGFAEWGYMSKMSISERFKLSYLLFRPSNVKSSWEVW